MPRSPRNNMALPPLLERVVRAADAERRRRAGRMVGNHSAALCDLAELFAVVLPARGVLAPEDDLCDQIDRVAQRYLHRRQAEDQFRAAIARVPSITHRDAIESAHETVLGVSELAHYYAGLAAGILLAGLSAGPGQR